MSKITVFLSLPGIAPGQSFIETWEDLRDCLRSFDEQGVACKCATRGNSRMFVAPSALGVCVCV